MKKFLKIFYIVFFTLALLSSKASAVPTFVDSFSVHSEETRPNGLTFNNDGTKMFVTGHTQDEINEYTLSTAWDVSTASFVDSFSTQSEDGDTRDVKFNQDGTKMFVLGKSNDRVFEYTLSTGFDVSSTVTFIDCKSVSPVGDPEELEFSPDGTKMFVLDNSGNDVNEFTLTTGFDISTASYVQTLIVDVEENTPTGLAFTYGGTKMFITGWERDTVIEYTLSTAFDISTASMGDSYAIADAVENKPSALTFSSDASKMFIMGRSGDKVHEYTLTCYYGVVNCMDPTSDKDDVASVEAQTESAKQLIQHTTYPVLNRMEWLRRNNNNSNLTNQNIKFQFSNEILALLSDVGSIKLDNPLLNYWIKKLPTKIVSVNGAVENGQSITIGREYKNKNSNNLNNFTTAIKSDNPLLNSWINKLPEKITALRASLKEKSSKDKKSNWSYWSEGTVSIGKIGDSLSSSAKNINTTAITIGADRRADNGRMFGLALRFGNDDINFGNVKNSLDVDTVSLTLYGSRLLGEDKFIDSLIGIGSFKTDIVNAVGSSSTKGTRDGSQIFSSFKIRETFKKNKLNFTPNIKLDLGFTSLSDYSENGSTNLKFDSQDIGTIITSIGGAVDSSTNLRNGTFKPYFEYDYFADMSPSSEQKISYISDTSSTYTLTNINSSTHNFKSKLGFDYLTYTGWDFTSSYQRTQSKGGGYSDALYFGANYISRRDIEYAMSLDNNKAFLDYKRNINGFNFTVGSNYTLMSEIPDYGANIEVSNTF